ncbi:hypothetical protein C2S52_001574 [Perilla frutescens var. hirtella]|nr:hypothetical protein C2S52_001574 [Perilla frutescens var. hirtella]
MHPKNAVLKDKRSTRLTLDGFMFMLSPTLGHVNSYPSNWNRWSYYILPLSSKLLDSSAGGGARMCMDMNVPFLGKGPLDPQPCKAAEEGRSSSDASKCRVAFLTVRLGFVDYSVMSKWGKFRID